MSTNYNAAREIGPVNAIASTWNISYTIDASREVENRPQTVLLSRIEPMISNEIKNSLQTSTELKTEFESQNLSLNRRKEALRGAGGVEHFSRLHDAATAKCFADDRSCTEIHDR